MFLRSTVYFQRPEEPGFLAVGEPGSGMIPVFSSLAELARFAGACAWASTIGEDLLGLAPAGFVFLLDPLGRHPHRFDPGPWQARGAGPDRTTEATGMTSSIATPGAPGGAA
ncbi:hypothetical protein GCM10010406_49040 [Streptomyces thermolineatus]|uniref:SseB protein N-terminal domain-containing protein n=1 Tax=Streptomyces thermolineatus TaxID=44033 RepID=A0ABP6A0G5_9ACTN